MIKNINKYRIFMKCFGHFSPSFLAKGLYEANQTKNKRIVNQVQDAMIDLKNDAHKMEIPKMKILIKYFTLWK